MFFLVIAALAGIQGSPPPVTIGPGIPITDELTDEQVARAVFVDAQMLLGVGSAVEQTPATAEAFVRLGDAAGCRAWDVAMREATEPRMAAWRAGWVSALRATIPEDVLRAVAQTGIQQGDQLIAPYREQIIAAITRQGTWQIAQQAADDMQARLTRAGAAAPEPRDRAAGLVVFQALRDQAGALCAGHPRQ